MNKFYQVQYDGEKLTQEQISEKLGVSRIHSKGSNADIRT